jgi:hypothetical protein
MSGRVGIEEEQPMSDERRPRGELDPVYVHARREAGEILLAWGVAMAWTIGYCAVFGYGRAEGDVRLVWGMPDWVVWGVVTPWVVASGFTLWFCLARMKEDSLGKADADRGSGEGGDGERGDS